MDPNETLVELREAISLYDGGPDHDYEAAGRFMNAFEALDEWLSKGGFLPDAWVNGNRDLFEA